MDEDAIYTSLPERPVSDYELRQRILEHLKENKEKWFNVKQIAEAVGFQEKDRTMPGIRLACKELLHFEDEPIASCHAGFSYTEQPSVMRRFGENIEQRIKGMQRTLDDIHRVMRGMENNNLNNYPGRYNGN